MNKLALRPRISEKAIAAAEAGVYVFEVPLTANKALVAQAVEKAFKVKVADVNIQIHKGKKKRFGRVMGRQKDTKKALVKLAKAQSIKLFEGAK